MRMAGYDVGGASYSLLGARTAKVMRDAPMGNITLMAAVQTLKHPGLSTAAAIFRATLCSKARTTRHALSGRDETRRDQGGHRPTTSMRRSAKHSMGGPPMARNFLDEVIDSLSQLRKSPGSRTHAGRVQKIDVRGWGLPDIRQQ